MFSNISTLFLVTNFWDCGFEMSLSVSESCQFLSLHFHPATTLLSNPPAGCVVMNGLLLSAPRSHSLMTLHLKLHVRWNDLFVDLRLWQAFIQPVFHYSGFSHLRFPSLLHLVKRLRTFRVVTSRAVIDFPPDDRLFNDCQWWVAWGHDHELSRERNVGNKVCGLSVRCRLNTQNASVFQRLLMACYELIILI